MLTFTMVLIIDFVDNVCFCAGKSPGADNFCWACVLGALMPLVLACSFIIE